MPNSKKYLEEIKDDVNICKWLLTIIVLLLIISTL